MARPYPEMTLPSYLKRLSPIFVFVLYKWYTKTSEILFYLAQQRATPVRSCMYVYGSYSDHKKQSFYVVATCSCLTGFGRCQWGVVVVCGNGSSYGTQRCQTVNVCNAAYYVDCNLGCLQITLRRVGLECFLCIVAIHDALWVDRWIEYFGEIFFYFSSKCTYNSFMGQKSWFQPT